MRTLLLVLMVSSLWLCTSTFAQDDGTKKMNEGSKLLTEGAKQVVQTETNAVVSFLDSIPWYWIPIAFVLGLLVGYIVSKRAPKKKPSQK